MIKQLTRVALMGVLFAALTAFTVGLQTIKIQTSAVCGMCKDRIEGTLNALEGVEEARLDLTTKKVKVKFDDSKQSEASLKAIITKIGYAADDLPANKEAFNALPGCCKSAKACAAEHPKMGDVQIAPASLNADAAASAVVDKGAKAKACAKGATAGKACCASKAKGSASASVDATTTAAPDRSSAVAAPAKACAKGATAGKACCASKATGSATAAVATESAVPAKACCSGDKAKSCAKDKAVGIK